jgi:hypothetical protein
MNGGIFLLQGDGSLVEMREQHYESEVVLQQLLAQYPHLLAGDPVSGAAPRRWLLVRRDPAAASGQQEGDRWSLDHLFLDQDAVPTFVEVKRGADAPARWEAVGRMLDGAANAVVSWPAEAIRARFEEGRGAEAAKELAALTGGDAGPDHFWQGVRANLEAGRVGMVFVADEIPPELRRVIEFLAGHMAPAEVWGVEIKQYVGPGGLKTLVPRVVGRTAEAGRKKPAGGAGVTWTEARFFEELTASEGPPEVDLARDLLDWAKRNTSRISWAGEGPAGACYALLDHLGQEHYVFAVWTSGYVEIPFETMLARPPFQEEAKRLELLNRLNRVHPGVKIPRDKIAKRPRINLDALTHGAGLTNFLGVLDWYVGEIRAA